MPKKILLRIRELREFIRATTDEFERILCLELPLGCCHGRSVCYATCLLIQPSHLPKGVIKALWFPIVANFDETEAVMILPSHLWPEKLAARLAFTGSQYRHLEIG